MCIGGSPDLTLYVLYSVCNTCICVSEGVPTLPYMYCIACVIRVYVVFRKQRALSIFLKTLEPQVYESEDDVVLHWRRSHGEDATIVQHLGQRQHHVGHG